LKIALEVNHVIIPAKDQPATAALLAYILGLEVEGCFGELVRIRSNDGLSIDFCEPQACWAFQCAFLISDTEFDAALTRIKSGTIEFYAECDRTGRGEINRSERCGRRIYFDDPDRHLFELIEQLDATATGRSIKAVASKLSPQERSIGSSK
jgi:catechol 2,3-dioxygenase-like lactoylglutathione lyase family enzyme